MKGLNAGVDLGGRADRDRPRRSPSPARRTRPRPNLDVEISKLSAKIEAGATFAQTQPVYDVAALDRFFARAEARAIPVLVGLIPPKSLKQALYFANEVPGMVVPEAILDRMRKAAEKGPEFEAEEGLAIGIELARAIARAGARPPPHADGAVRRRAADPRGAAGAEEPSATAKAGRRA